MKTRSIRMLAIGLTLAAVLAACGSSGSSKNDNASTGGTTAGTASANSVASQMVFGGAPECPQRPFCLQGLETTYGLKFKDFKSLDAGGPLTVAALKNGDIQIGLIFTTDGQIAANNWVLLEDDKNLQPSDNVTPIVNDATASAYPDLGPLANTVSAKITTEDLTDLNKQVDVDKKDPEAVAKQWVQDNDLIPATTPAAVSGPTVVVGSADFGESEILADIYAEVFKANGYNVSKKLRIGSREIYFPALTSGEISFVPDYAGTLLVFVDPTASASTDPDATHAALVTALQGKGVTALDSSPAQDKNGFVVTQETAQKYNLQKLSDLANPAS